MALHTYWDTIARFDLPNLCIQELALVASQEAGHFSRLNLRLAKLGHKYGDFPTNATLSEWSDRTKGSFIDRIAVTTLVNEARGLDSQERLVVKFNSIDNSKESAKLVKDIVDEEVEHVRTGMKWFTSLCNSEDPGEVFRDVLSRHRIKLHPPFNETGKGQLARTEATFPKSWYTSQ